MFSNRGILVNNISSRKKSRTSNHKINFYNQ
jgi:hypothetical protein